MKNPSWTVLGISALISRGLTDVVSNWGFILDDMFTLQGCFIVSLSFLQLLILNVRHFNKPTLVRKPFLLETWMIRQIMWLVEDKCVLTFISNWTPYSLYSILWQERCQCHGFNYKAMHTLIKCISNVMWLKPNA